MPYPLEDINISSHKGSYRARDRYSRIFLRYCRYRGLGREQAISTHARRGISSLRGACLLHVDGRDVIFFLFIGRKYNALMTPLQCNYVKAPVKPPTGRSNAVLCDCLAAVLSCRAFSSSFPPPYMVRILLMLGE